MDGNHPSGAKARDLFCGSCGTTEVVPCYKMLAATSFSAAFEVVPCFKARADNGNRNLCIHCAPATHYYLQGSAGEKDSRQAQ